MKITKIIKCSSIGGSNSRTKELMRICPEYRKAVSDYEYSAFKRENPNLAEACNLFLYSHGNIDSLDEQLDLLDEDHSDISNTLVELTNLFSQAGEIELAMYTTRWMHDNGYSNGQSSFRL